MLSADPARVREWRQFREELATVTPERRAAMLSRRANTSRGTDLAMIGRAGLGHVGGDLSVLDVLTTLYFAVLRVDPEKPEWEDRDRFVLSKGHTAGALYTTLAAAGFFPESELQRFASDLSPLNGHPNRVKVPGVETNTGPLGHGLSVAVGMAVAAKMAASQRRIFVALGDGELQEGSNWEAAMTAGHRRLDNMIAFVDRNRLQQGARTEQTVGLDPLPAKFDSFGWRTLELDGHDHLALLAAIGSQVDGRPTCIVANTVKGKGVSFMEDRVEWHHKVPTADQIVAAHLELSA